MCVGQAAFILAALVTLAMTGSATLAGLATSVIFGGRVLIVYQTGKLMDRIGRRAVLLIGIGLATAALLMMGLAVLWSGVLLFWFGLLLYGFGSGVLQQARVAVADMYPADRRGEGIGFLMTGNVVGSILSPLFTAMLIPLAAYFALDSYGMILLVSMFVLAFSSVFILAVKPDPGDIAKNLEAYYAGLASDDIKTDNGFDSVPVLRAIIFYPILVGFVASALATGDMSMMMSLVSVIMHQHEIAITLISIAVSLHVIGMYGFSVPIGWLTDKLGRKAVIVLGAVVMGLGAFLTPLTASYSMVTLSIFLVGLGWSAANIATTALISDFSPPQRRGRLLGANDVVIGLASLSLPALGGAVIANAGLLALGLLGLVVAIPSVLIALPLRETKPGIYSERLPLTQLSSDS